MNKNDYIRERYKRYTIRFSYAEELDIIEHLKTKKSVKKLPEAPDPSGPVPAGEAAQDLLSPVSVWSGVRAVAVHRC